MLTRLAGAAEAEDLRQETLIRVFRAAGRYQATGPFSAWLFRIALNLARDVARRRRPLEPLDAANEPAQHDGQPLDERETAELVEAAARRLPHKLREALVLRYYADMTFPEIAEATDTPLSTVKSRVAAGLKRLHASLARLGVTESEAIQ